jgi:leader peptidase (prepilin peptidase)/N-methyltransferase
VGGVAGVALPGVRRAHRIRGNVPLLSYVLLRVRCRNCKARISARYPLVEALTGILFAGAAYEFGLGLELLLALALVLALVALARTDLEYQLLPNVIVGPAALVGVTLSVLQGPERW